MRPLLAGLALLTTILLSACGETTVDATKGERLIRGVVAEQVDARVRSVRCPTGVKKQEGDTFTCTVTGVDGSRGDVVVTQRGGGGLAVVAPFLHVREAETVMAARIGKRIKASDVKLSCPEIVVVKQGSLFKCEATAKGRERNVTVRLTDAEGHFRYRLS
jgi:hypothetical protein